MEKTLDGLIEYLVDQIAINGKNGLPCDSFASQVESYYFGTLDISAKQSSGSIPKDGLVKLDQPFLQLIWQWLLKHPEVSTKDGSTTDSIQSSRSSHAPRTRLLNFHREANVEQSRIRSPLIAFDRALRAHIRLVTSKNRMWHALTGHGPDLTKVKDLDFVLLSIIACSGIRGVLQHDLVRLSGQDKRSLPHRTDRLSEDGYIRKEKVTVLSSDAADAPRLHTSLCTLTRFAEDQRHVEAVQALQQQAAAKPTKKKLRKSRMAVSVESQTTDEGAKPTADSLPLCTTANQTSRWVADRSIQNQVLDAIARSGKTGMTMSQIRNDLTGEQYKKSTEYYLSRLVDAWQLSQPLHLRHLAIVRDTILLGRSPVFVHYTFESYSRLVAEGKASWQAVMTIKGNTEGGPAVSPIDAHPKLDVHQFPMIDSDAYYGQRGDVFLETCISAVQTKTRYGRRSLVVDGRRGPQSGDIVPNHDFEDPLRPPPPSDEAPLAKLSSALPKKRLGRPRKSDATNESKELAMQVRLRSLGAHASHSGSRKRRSPGRSTPINTAIQVVQEQSKLETATRPLPAASRTRSKRLAAPSLSPQRDLEAKEGVPVKPSLSQRSQDQMRNKGVFMAGEYAQLYQLLPKSIEGCFCTKTATEERYNRQGHLESKQYMLVVIRLKSLKSIFSAFNSTGYTRDLDPPSLNFSQWQENGSDNRVVSTELPTADDGPLAASARSFSRLSNSQLPVATSMRSSKQAETKRLSIGRLGRTGGSTAMLRRSIVLDLVKRSGGVGPGYKELAVPFSIEWTKRGQPGQPDVDTVKSAVTGLCAVGLLRQITFAYQTKEGLSKKKTLLTLPDIAASDSRVREMREKLEEANNRVYIPESLLGDENPKVYGKRLENPLEQESGRGRSPDIYQNYLHQRYFYHKNRMERSSEDFLGQGSEQLQSRSIVPPYGSNLEAQRGVKRLASLKNHTATDDVRPLLYPSHRIFHLSSRPDSWLPCRQFMTATVSQSPLTFRWENGMRPVLALPGKRKTLSQPHRESSSILHNKPSTPLLSRIADLEKERFPTPDMLLETRSSFPLPSERRIFKALTVTEGGNDQSAIENDLERTLQWELCTPAVKSTLFRRWTFINHSPSFAKSSILFKERPVRKMFLYNFTMTRDSIIEEDVQSMPLQATPNLSTLAPKSSWPRSEECLESPFHRLFRSGKGQKRHANANLDDPAKRKRKRIFGKPGSLSNEDKLLLSAVVAVKILTGASEETLNWSLVQNALKDNSTFDLDLVGLRERWLRLLQVEIPAFGLIETRFRESFLEAYESSELPRLDFEALDTYPWTEVAQWTLKLAQAENNQDAPLIESTEAFLQVNAFVPLPEQDYADLYEFETAATTHMREIALNQHCWTVAIPPSNSYAKGQGDLLFTARTWIRATAAARPESYDGHLARSRLEQIPPSVISAAVKSLIDDKIISSEPRKRGKFALDRQYVLNENTFLRLQRIARVEDYRTAGHFKHHLDAQLAAHGITSHSEHAGNGDVMAIINLEAHRRIKLEPRNVPMNPFGMTEGSYETRQMDKKKLFFDIDIVRVEKYIDGNPLQPLPPPPSPFSRGTQKLNLEHKIPLWYDIFGNLINSLWEQSLGTVLGLLATRPGTGLAKVAKVLWPLLEAWEIESILDWLAVSGAARAHGEGEQRRWQTEEWWWLVLDGSADEPTPREADRAKTRWKGKEKEA